MKLLIGCPVRERAWIIRDWIRHVEAAAELAGVTPEYVFALPEWDTETLNRIEKLLDGLERDHSLVFTHEPKTPTEERRWSVPRIAEMARIRNLLLDKVREREPERFLSVDSDVLLAEKAIATLRSVEGYDAVGGKCFMTPTFLDHLGRPKGIPWCPSYAMVINAAGLHRADTDQVIPVDVIMAVKLMTPAAYAVPYGPHHHGEDFGWAANVRGRGLKLGWDGRVTSKHVMLREELERVDPRVGF